MWGPFATASRRTPHCHSPGVATVARRLRIDVHNDDDDDNNDNDNAWQRRPLWSHRMGPINDYWLIDWLIVNERCSWWTTTARCWAGWRHWKKKEFCWSTTFRRREDSSICCRCELLTWERRASGTYHLHEINKYRSKKHVKFLLLFATWIVVTYCNKKWKSTHGRVGRCPKPTRIVISCTPQYGKCGVLHFCSFRRLACRTISASTELLVY